MTEADLSMFHFSPQMFPLNPCVMPEFHWQRSLLSPSTRFTCVVLQLRSYSLPTCRCWNCALKCICKPEENIWSFLEVGLVPIPVFFILRALVFPSNCFFDIEGKCTGLKVKTNLDSGPASAIYWLCAFDRPECQGFMFVCLFLFFLAFQTITSSQIISKYLLRLQTLYQVLGVYGEQTSWAQALWSLQ